MLEDGFASLCLSPQFWDGQYISTLKKGLDLYDYSGVVVTYFLDFTNQENKKQNWSFAQLLQTLWRLTNRLPTFHFSKLEHLIKWTAMSFGRNSQIHPNTKMREQHLQISLYELCEQLTILYFWSFCLDWLTNFGLHWLTGLHSWIVILCLFALVIPSRFKSFIKWTENKR
jgi:hypothetical protein